MDGKDGWIRHRGGKCPADLTALVEVRYRNGSTDDEHIAGELSWVHYGETDDIMAYRIIEEEKQEMAGPDIYAASEDFRDEPISVEYQSTDGPLDWRDRIREIDAYMIGEKEAHKRLIESAETERAELVAKLAAEGLALCGEPIKAIEQAQDMSDPSKWKEGDLIEIIGDDSHKFEVGEIVRLKVFELDHRSDGHRYEHLDRRDYWWVKHKCAKFHSRP